MTQTESRIRERAYAIWQQQGEPTGQHLHHWQQASREIAQELEAQPDVRREAVKTASAPRRKAAPGGAKGQGKAVKPARPRKRPAASPE